MGRTTRYTLSEALELLRAELDRLQHAARVGATVAARYRESGLDLGALARGTASAMAREARRSATLDAIDRREARHDVGGRETGVVKSGPSARRGMVSAIDRQWHGASGYGAGQTEQDALRNSAATTRDAEHSTKRLGAGGSRNVQCSRGVVSRIQPNAATRRRVARITSRMTEGSANHNEVAELLGIVRYYNSLR